MPTKPKRTEKSGRSYIQHWTREEQIENAKESDTIEEMKPPLTTKERSDHAIPNP